VRYGRLVATRFSSAARCSDMAKLIYIANVSVDGFIEDAGGSFDWTEPEEDVFAFITDLVRPVGTCGVVYLRYRNPI
jgi:hypothetical protein